MSDSWLQLIPKDPKYVPVEERIMAAVNFVENLFPASDEVIADIENSVYFFDPGNNWEGVRCRKCAIELESWWQECMVTAAASDFSELEFILPCCNESVSLNGLDYIQPAGFARFSIEVMNPGAELSADQLASIEQCLDTELRQINLRI